MRKVFGFAAAAALCLAFAPVAAPAFAEAADYVQTSYSSFSYDDGTWVLGTKNTHKYNKKGLMTASTYALYQDGKASSTSKTTYTYDKKKRRKAAKNYENGKLSYSEKFAYGTGKTTSKRYDKKGKYAGKQVIKSTKKKVVSQVFNKKGKVTEKYVQTRTAKGVTKTYKSYKDGKLSYSMKNTIKNGKITKTVSKTYDNGKLEYTHTSKFSYSGKYTTEESYNEDGTLSIAEKYYTEKKTGTRITSWVKYYYDGKLGSTTTYKHTKFTSGKLKGIVKQSVGSIDGTPVSKTEYAYKVL